MQTIQIPAGLAAIANGRDILSAKEAAPTIGRKPQTLHKWACQENGPIRPVRIAGRVFWRVADLARLLTNGG